MNLEPLKALIRRFEGWRSRPYVCPAGVPTIGYGATRYPDGRKVTLKDKALSLQEGEALLDHDAALYARAAVGISPNLRGDTDKLSAIADFVYNLGSTRYRASTLRRRVADGNWPEAARELRRWVWGGGRKLPGLIKRREAEAQLVLKPAPKADAPAVQGGERPITRAELLKVLLDAKAAGRDPFAALVEMLQATGEAAP